MDNSRNKLIVFILVVVLCVTTFTSSNVSFALESKYKTSSELYAKLNTTIKQRIVDGNFLDKDGNENEKSKQLVSDLLKLIDESGLDPYDDPYANLFKVGRKADELEIPSVTEIKSNQDLVDMLTKVNKTASGYIDHYSTISGYLQTIINDAKNLTDAQRESLNNQRSVIAQLCQILKKIDAHNVDSLSADDVDLLKRFTTFTLYNDIQKVPKV